MSMFVLGVKRPCDVKAIPFTTTNHPTMTPITTTIRNQARHTISTHHPELQHDPFDPISEPQQRDRFFDPWRVPSTKPAALLVTSVIQQIASYEIAQGIRERRRSIRQSENHDLAVTSIVCDLLHYALSGHTGGIAIPRSHRFTTTKSRYRPAFIGKTLPDILDIMAADELSFIRQEVGYEAWTSDRHQLTKIYPGERLLRLMDKYDIRSEHIRFKPPRECIVLKSAKEGFWDNSQPIEYVDTNQTHVFRSEIQLINDWIGGAKIEYLPHHPEGDIKVDTADRHLRRIFTYERFDSGGRLFGGFWQGMKKVDRKGIIIEGEPACELDYKQIAPRILYGVAGAKPPDGDLYDIPQFRNDPLKSTYRDGFKTLLNTLLFIDKPIKSKPKNTSHLLPSSYSVQDLADMLRSHHHAIAPYFERGIGHYLQFLESQILIDVLMRLRDRGIVALPIHDAILIPASRVIESGDVMKTTFYDHTGVSISLSLTNYDMSHKATNNK